MHRNSLRNLLIIFHKKIDKQHQELLLSGVQLSLEEIQEQYS
jgi:hypothetical protein